MKPEFFTHEGLFEAERETGFPIRIAYEGLWCAADREGRFKWEPRRLKLSILPYDELDFSRVLDALATRGFLVKYRVGEAWFGSIPTFSKHQVVNNRESASCLPGLSEAEQLDASSTREARVGHAGQGEGKGREGKGSPPPPAVTGDSRHAEICSRWGELYEGAFGIKYVFEGRDPKALQRFLQSTKDTAEIIMTVAVQAWERHKQDRFAAYCKQASTIYGLCGAYNNIRTELQTPHENAKPGTPNSRGYEHAHPEQYRGVTDK